MSIDSDVNKNLSHSLSPIYISISIVIFWWAVKHLRLVAVVCLNDCFFILYIFGAPSFLVVAWAESS